MSSILAHKVFLTNDIRCFGKLYCHGDLMKIVLIAALGMLLLAAGTALAAGGGGSQATDLNFPPSLASYDDGHLEGIGSTLVHRVDIAPFNLVATLIFLCAIIHTFLTSKFLEISHRWAHQHTARIERGEKPKDSVHFGAGIFHFLGEVEAGHGAAKVVAQRLRAGCPDRYRRNRPRRRNKARNWRWRRSCSGWSRPGCRGPRPRRGRQCAAPRLHC